jgi:hypothetical protein
VKEEASTPTLMASDNNMDLLDDDESPLIKDESPSPTVIDINMVSRYRVSSGVSRRRPLRCVLAPRRSCSRSLRSRASTYSHCTFEATLTKADI